MSPQFYVTAPQPCPYLPGRMERKLFTALSMDTAEALNSVLSMQGFRRSQNVLYRPACTECALCLSARIRVADFVPSRSQKRVLKANAGMIRDARVPWATEDQFDLFRRYLEDRHRHGGMADMSEGEFAAMVEDSQVRARLVEYWGRTEAGDPQLQAVCLTDMLADGLSMVYSFFEPSLTSRSLGTYLILDHIEMARATGLPYVYLGYWVPGSPKMDYKRKFQPLELFRDGCWQPLEEGDTAATLDTEQPPIAEQIAAITLPPRPDRG